MKKCIMMVLALAGFCIGRAQTNWHITGNAGTDPFNNFIGTTDSKPLRFRVGNVNAGLLDSATGQTSLGYLAGGYPGSYGFRSVSIGLMNCYQGPSYETTSVGAYSLYYNSGYYNTAIGYGTLYSNSYGSNNTAMGYAAGQGNTSGYSNCSYGSYAQNYMSTGNQNVGVGDYSLYSARSSSCNTAIGYAAGYGYDLGWNNTILGANCGGSFDGQYNMIAIGQGVTCPGNSTARIGNSATWSIGGFVGWSSFSDGRFKKDVQENVKGLDFIMRLRPVTYRLDVSGLSKQLKENQGKEWSTQMKAAIADKENSIFTGFIAQEVEQAAKDAQFNFSGVDKPQKDNDLYALRYAEFVVPLVKAVQELQQKVEALQKQADLTILLYQDGGAAGEKLSAYPNPAGSNMTVALQTQQAGSGTLQIFDSAGKLIKQMNTDIHTGINQLSLSIPELAAGHYTIRLDWGTDMHKQVSFIKVK